MAREDLSHMFRQHQNFHKAAQEHQRRTREAVNQAVVESSVPLETRLMMDVRAVEVNNERQMAVRERKIAHRLADEMQRRRVMAETPTLFNLGGWVISPLRWEEPIIRLPSVMGLCV